MSPNVPPTPPLSSGTAISGRPISSISFQRSAGQAPCSTAVHHVAAAALGEETVGGLEQHVAGVAVHQMSPRSSFTSS